MRDQRTEMWVCLFTAILLVLMMIWNGNRRYQEGHDDGLLWGAVGYHNYVIHEMEETDQDSVSRDDLLEIMKKILSKKKN